MESTSILKGSTILERISRWRETYEGNKWEEEVFFFQKEKERRKKKVNIYWEKMKIFRRHLVIG